MVSFEYLRAARIKQQQPRTSKFNPFGDEEDILDGYPHMSMFKFLDEDSPPFPGPIQPPTKKHVPIRPPGFPSPQLGFVKLHHPRPPSPKCAESDKAIYLHVAFISEYKDPQYAKNICLNKALARFEETTVCAEFVANGKGMKKPVREPVFRPLTEEEQAARRAKRAIFNAVQPSWRQKHGRVFFTPEEKLQMQTASENTVKGPACISPSFLDHFQEHAKRQCLWRHGPCPEDLPKPSFVSTNATIRRVVPTSSPTPPLPFQNKVDNIVEEGHGAGPLDYYEDDYPNDSWSEHSSDFDDVEQLEEDNSHIFPKSFDEQSSVHECEDAHDEYCAVSEYSGYDADDDTFGDEEGSVYAPSSRASPNPFLFPCPYPSTGSLTYSFSPSPTDCEIHVYSGSSEELDQDLSPPSAEWRESEEASSGDTRPLDPNCHVMLGLATRVRV